MTLPVASCGLRVVRNGQPATGNWQLVKHGKKTSESF